MVSIPIQDRLRDTAEEMAEAAEQLLEALEQDEPCNELLSRGWLRDCIEAYRGARDEDKG